MIPVFDGNNVEMLIDIDTKLSLCKVSDKYSYKEESY